MCLVADLLDQVQPRMVGGELQRVLPAGEPKRLQPRFAFFPFRDTHELYLAQAKLREYLTSHAELTLSAVDQHQIRQARLAGDQASVAPLQYFAHGRIVVPC